MHRQDLENEFEALEDMGVSVPDEAWDLARGDLTQYDNMGVTECADLFILLGS